MGGGREGVLPVVRQEPKKGQSGRRERKGIEGRRRARVGGGRLAVELKGQSKDQGCRPFKGKRTCARGENERKGATTGEK